MVTDTEFLAGLQRCKELGALAMVHGENGDAVAEGQRYVFEELGVTGPEGHCLSRPAILEAEATGRAIRLAAFVGTPLYVVHVMSEGAMNEVRCVYTDISITLLFCMEAQLAAPQDGRTFGTATLLHTMTSSLCTNYAVVTAAMFSHC